MDILSAVWNALTVENEMLVKIINIPLTFIELYLAMLIFTHILKINYSKKQCILYILSLSSVGILTMFLIPKPYNTFINIIVLPTFVYLFFETTIFVAILSEIIQYIIFIFLGVILQAFYTKLFSITLNELMTVPIHQIIYSIVLYFSLLMIYLIARKSHSHNIRPIRQNTSKSVLIINFIIGTIAIAFDSLIVTKFFYVLPFQLVIANLSVLLLYFIISMYSLYRTVTLEETTENLEEEKLYNKTLNILYDNVRGFKHDFNNIIQSIGGYISSNNIDGLRKYYSELLKDCKQVNNLTVLNPEVINNPAIYSILTYKYHKAEELGIKIVLDVFLDLSNLKINTYEFTKILGILLDNAIEASSKTTEKTINITIRKDSKVDRDLFIIENSYSNKNINLDKIFEKGYTSKETESSSHGIGLWEVRKILKKSKNLNLYTTKTSQIFKQQLEIYNEKL